MSYFIFIITIYPTIFPFVSEAIASGQIYFYNFTKHYIYTEGLLRNPDVYTSFQGYALRKFKCTDISDNDCLPTCIFIHSTNEENIFKQKFIIQKTFY